MSRDDAQAPTTGHSATFLSDAPIDIDGNRDVLSIFSGTLKWVVIRCELVFGV